MTGNGTGLTAYACTIAGCQRPHLARGYCQAHYRRLRRTGTTDGPNLPDWNPDLTTERRVLDLVVRGFTNAEIGHLLELSRSRVNWYLRELRAKAGVERKHELIEYALADKRRLRPPRKRKRRVKA